MRYTVIPMLGGFEVFDTATQSSCIHTWTLYRDRAKKLAGALDKAHAVFTTAAFFAKAAINRECEQ